MGKIIHIDDEVAKMLDEIRKERRCSYTKAIAMALAEKGRKERILRRIESDFEYYKEIMPNVEYELEILRTMIVWFYNAPGKHRKEIAGAIREPLEALMLQCVRSVRSERRKKGEDKT